MGRNQSKSCSDKRHSLLGELEICPVRFRKRLSARTRTLARPQFPDRWWREGETEPWNEVDVGDGKAIEFLDTCKTKYGSQSVLFIR